MEQVGRDLANFRLKGSLKVGYQIKEFMEEVYGQLESETQTKMVLVGAGNLGKAVISFLLKRRPNLAITAAFDSDPDKTGRDFMGCQVHHMDQLEKFVARDKTAVGIITVPETSAQAAADALISAGVGGILNFAPLQLKVPPGVFLEQLDITLSVEKAAYFSRRMKKARELKNKRAGKK